MIIQDSARWWFLGAGWRVLKSQLYNNDPTR